MAAEKKANAYLSKIRTNVAAKYPEWSAKKVAVVSYNIFKSAIAKKAAPVEG